MITRLEEQVVTDDAGARLDVQVIREPEQRLIVLRVIEVEYVLVVDRDVADHRTGGLEIRIARHTRSVAWRSRLRCSRRKQKDQGEDWREQS